MHRIMYMYYMYMYMYMYMYEYRSTYMYQVLVTLLYSYGRSSYLSLPGTSTAKHVEMLSPDANKP